MSSKDHYNHVAQHPPVMCTALRSAHRQAKRALLYHAVQQACGEISAAHIVDFACGRGGDMVKCVGCASYVGVDTADQALVELQRRAMQVGIRATTYCMDAADMPDHACNIAMCNFALHYFCDTRAHMCRLLDKVRTCLMPTGVFCGTYQRWPGGNDVQWGEAYHAVVGDCVNAVEYKVPWHVIVKYAASKGLAVICHAPLQSLHSESDQSIWFFIMRLSSPSQHYGTSATA